jgi:hypothetical protein
MLPHRLQHWGFLPNDQTYSNADGQQKAICLALTKIKQIDKFA